MHREIVDLIWDRLDGREVLRILCSSSPYFPEFKPVLFAALSAHVFSNGQKRFRRSGAAAEIIRQMALQEKRLLTAESRYEADVLMVRTLANRLNIESDPFYHLIYLPLGGINLGNRSLPRNDVYRRLKARAHGIDLIIKLMGLHHFHADFLRNYNRYSEISFERSKQAAVHPAFWDVSEPIKNKHTWEKSRRKFMRYAAFIYAADNVDCKDGKFLDVILSGNATWPKHEREFKEWMEKTHYVLEHIVSHSRGKKLARAQLRWFPEDVVPAPFACSVLTREQDAIIRAEYSSEGRGRVL